MTVWANNSVREFYDAYDMEEGFQCLNPFPELSAPSLENIQSARSPSKSSTRSCSVESSTASTTAPASLASVPEEAAWPIEESVAFTDNQYDNRQRRSRPCKAQRNRYRKSARHLEEWVVQSPETFDADALLLPPSIASRPHVKKKLMSRLLTLRSEVLSSQTALGDWASEYTAFDWGSDHIVSSEGAYHVADFANMPTVVTSEGAYHFADFAEAPAGHAMPRAEAEVMRTDYMEGLSTFVEDLPDDGSFVEALSDYAVSERVACNAEQLVVLSTSPREGTGDSTVDIGRRSGRQRPCKGQRMRMKRQAAAYASEVSNVKSSEENMDADLSLKGEAFIKKDDRPLSDSHNFQWAQ